MTWIDLGKKAFKTLQTLDPTDGILFFVCSLFFIMTFAIGFIGIFTRMPLMDAVLISLLPYGLYVVFALLLRYVMLMFNLILGIQTSSSKET